MLWHNDFSATDKYYLGDDGGNTMKRTTKKCMALMAAVVLLLTMTMHVSGATLEADNFQIVPASGTANENSFLKHTIDIPTVYWSDEEVSVTRTEVQSIRIGGNGNSARLIVKIDNEEYTTTVRPVNNALNTVTVITVDDEKFEIDVFVRGNKIDGESIKVFDLNCYNDCPSNEGCTPKRDNPCVCECECDLRCKNECGTCDYACETKCGHLCICDSSSCNCEDLDTGDGNEFDDVRCNPCKNSGKNPGCATSCWDSPGNNANIGNGQNWIPNSCKCPCRP